MARTNFAGPITAGKRNDNSGGAFGKPRNVGFVNTTQSFTFDFNQALPFTGAYGAATIATIAAGATTAVFTANMIATGNNITNLTQGFRGSAQVNITFNAAEAGDIVTIVGTDIFGTSTTEAITLPAGAATQTTSGTHFQTITSITSNAAPANNVTIGQVNSAAGAQVEMCLRARSLFNSFPMQQTTATSGATPSSPAGSNRQNVARGPLSTAGKNLANNIIIPAFSRITDMRIMTGVAFAGSTNLTAGLGTHFSNNGAVPTGQVAPANQTFQKEYFCGIADIQGLDTRHVGHAGELPFANGTNITAVQQYANYANVSDLEMASGTSATVTEKELIITLNANGGGVMTAGQATVLVSYLQGVNLTN